MTALNKKITKTTLFYIALILIAIIWIISIYTLLATAVKSKQDFFSGLGLFSLPKNFAWVNFANAFTKGNLGRYMVNGLIICVLKVPLGIFVEALAAFAMTRLNVRHKTAIFVFFLVGMMLPMQSGSMDFFSGTVRGTHTQ